MDHYEFQRLEIKTILGVNDDELGALLSLVDAYARAGISVDIQALLNVLMEPPSVALLGLDLDNADSE